MNIFSKLLLGLFLIVISSGYGYKRTDYREGMYNNVCKDLKNDILVYFIFVDSKITSPWTEFDIRTTLDSMQTALRWIEEQAKLNGIPLNILSDYYIGQGYTTVRKNLPFESVVKSVNTPNQRKGFEGLNQWADYIAKKVGTDMQVSERDGIPEIKNPKNKERLVAHLRDEKKVESVVLLYMVNNYFRDDISLPVNQLNTKDVEFAIVSYKYPAIIAQNILNLFGAADLSKTIYRRNEKKIKIAMDFFPHDIMQDVYAKRLDDLKIGEYTKYLIGWTKNLDPKYHTLLTDGLVNY
jgi:hypothetical protein